MRPNYFVCTLGQAAGLKSGPNPYQTIGDFLTHQAQQHGNVSAVGFPLPRKDSGEWNYKVLTFRDVERGVHVFADRLFDQCGPALQKSHTVALLSHSSPEFMFTWLSLIKLGCSVLLIAPQCQAPAIAHLCKSCQVSILFHSAPYSDLAAESVAAIEDDDPAQFKGKLLPLGMHEDIFQVIQQEPKSELPTPKIEETSIAYLHHTSGTSSGMPKPIPQSHRAAMGVLPHLPDRPTKATFTTTPLYHGGIADLFRAWTSDALIWLFPEREVPITARNICQCLDMASKSSSTNGSPSVGYFSSVPYVLQMMEADDRGLELLKSIEVVGVGGAALPAEVGNRLVEKGVHLISRFGSAECGFLLSSYRDFDTDNDWQYLRNFNPPNLLEFEQNEEGLSELVVKPGWPHMAKTNREDGSLATADLFKPHSKFNNAWLYHSRADAQLTLITGKKFDPAPLEAAVATSPHLDDVLIFGNDRPFPGALLLRSEQSKSIPDSELLKEIKSVFEELNKGSQKHARIPLNMLIPLPYQQEGLEKSSKGTIIRRSAETRFKKYIEQAYEDQISDENVDVADKDLPEHLTNLIQATVSKDAPLSTDTDLFAYGMDSIACMQLRRQLQRLVPDGQDELPLSIVEDCGTVHVLSEYISQKRGGAATGVSVNEEQMMIDLVERLGNFEAATPQAEQTSNGSNTTTSGEVVVLTGATGALGAHILDMLSKDPNVTSIYCLVRGADHHVATERVSKALEQRGLESLSSQNEGNQKILVLPAQLGDPTLGLAEDVYEDLAAHSTVVIHVAWTVNFRLRLHSFVKDNIAGVQNLINLALKRTHTRPARFVFCSSTAAVMNAQIDQENQIPEQILSEPSAASPLGYSRSKWVAEHICSNASQRSPLRTAVVRVGQLSGASNSGIWNTKEAWPMMLSTVRLTGSLPNLPDEPLDWLPVDIAAEALLEAAGSLKIIDKRCSVYHVLNEHRQPTWSDMLRWLQKRETFDVVTPDEWVKQLEQHQHTGHPALKLLGLWKDAYRNSNSEKSFRPQFAMEETKKHVPVLRNVQPVSEEYMARIWTWVQENVH
jgi:thioester reductase-like protein